MKSGYYRSGQAARVWAISSHRVRRLCEAGLIEAERTSSGQWKIPCSEVERISKEGVPEIPSSIAEYADQVAQDDGLASDSQLVPDSTPVANLGDFVAPANCTGSQDWEEESQPLRARSNNRRVPEVAEPFQETKALDPRAVRVEAENERIAWHDSWMATALRSVPLDAPPEVRLLVRESVSDVLEHFGPAHSCMVIDSLVTAAVAKALLPWNQQRETLKAIETVCSILPPEAKDFFTPTIWQSRAREASAAAIKKLPADCTFWEKLCACRVAVQQITAEFEDDELRKRIVRQAYLFDIVPEERENAKEAIRRKLAELSMGTQALTMESAREHVLIPFRESKKRKERVDRSLEHIREYLERLYRTGETNFDNTWAVLDFAKRLEGRLRPAVEQELFNADLNDEELFELIEDLVDEDLD